MNEHIEKFTAYFHRLVIEHEEIEKRLKQEIFNVKRQNKELIKKLERYADVPEVSPAEIYLLEENERLIEEIEQLKKMDCQSLTIKENGG